MGSRGAVPGSRGAVPGSREAASALRTVLGPARTSLSLFTVIPVGAVARVGREEAVRAVLWLPAAGLLIAVPSAGILLAVEAGGQSAPRRLLAAALAVAALGLLTGGLHLDGLADTADGVGSRRPRDEALAIMRRPDIGPFGVAALLFVVLVQVAALATVRPGWPGAAALVLAVVTARVAAVLATGTASQPARPDGFGALVAAGTSAGSRAAVLIALLAAAAGSGQIAGGAPLALRSVAAALTGLAAAALLRRAAVRRLGGVTGDVFGALVEICTATVLIALAITL